MRFRVLRNRFLWFLKLLVIFGGMLVVNGLLFYISYWLFLVSVAFGLGMVVDTIVSEGFDVLDVLDFVLLVFGWHGLGLYFIVLSIWKMLRGV